MKNILTILFLVAIALCESRCTKDEHSPDKIKQLTSGHWLGTTEFSSDNGFIAGIYRFSADIDKDGKLTAISYTVDIHGDYTNVIDVELTPGSIEVVNSNQVTIKANTVSANSVVIVFTLTLTKDKCGTVAGRMAGSISYPYSPDELSFVQVNSITFCKQN